MCIKYLREHEIVLSRKGESNSFQRHQSKGLMLLVERHRPLDSKSIARHTEILVIKGNTMTMKMEMSTFLTEKR